MLSMAKISGWFGYARFDKSDAEPIGRDVDFVSWEQCLPGIGGANGIAASSVLRGGGGGGKPYRGCGAKAAYVATVVESAFSITPAGFYRRLKRQPKLRAGSLIPPSHASQSAF